MISVKYESVKFCKEKCEINVSVCEDKTQIIFVWFLVWLDKRQFTFLHKPIVAPSRQEIKKVIIRKRYYKLIFKKIPTEVVFGFNCLQVSFQQKLYENS